MNSAEPIRLHQQGLTLIELMIAIALGLFVVMTAIGLLISNKAAYIAQDQHAHVQETGRYAMEILSRAIRQAGYEHWDNGVTPAFPSSKFSAHVMGMDAMTLKKNTVALDAATATGVVNGSDVLALRFFGASTDGEDGAILNCAGLAVPAASDGEERSWSIFFVAKDNTGEPELRCKYRTKASWNADAIARGVESFQVLYGVDADDDGLPEHYLNASGVDALDDQLSLLGDNAIARAEERNRKSHWKKIRAIKLALLIRGSQAARDDALAMEYKLFGDAYSDAHAADDLGVHIFEETLPFETRNRVRKIFTHTIQLRNDAAGSGA